MFKALARPRFVGHVFTSKSCQVAPALLPHVRPSSQTRCSSQKRLYSVASIDSQTSTAPPTDLPAADAIAPLARHLNRVFSPLQFPPELAARILTHTSYRDWRVANNARLSFVGRRVLSSYLLLFLTSSSALDATHDLQQLAERTLEPHLLGEYVAPPWDLGRVMRWTPVQSAVPGDNTSIGLYKIQGTTVEAVMGGIYHQFGGAVAHRVFHTRLLPHLLLPGKSIGLHDAFHADAMRILQEMGGPEGDLFIPGTSSSTSDKIR